MGKTRYVDFLGPTTAKYWSGGTNKKYPVNNPVNILFHNWGKEWLAISSGHPYQLLGRTRRDIGGAFYVEKQEWSGIQPSFRSFSATTNPHEPGFHYEGPVCENVGYTSAIMPTPNASTVSELEAIGTTLIADAIPTNPLSGLLVALAELRSEGIPSVPTVNGWKQRASVARAAGGEFLNAQFGWLPLIGDIERFSIAMRKSNELIAQYEKNSGVILKRTRSLPISVSTEVSSGGNRSTAPDIPQMYSGTSHKNWVKTETRSKRIWLRAAFQYYLPPFVKGLSNVERQEQLANYLYGTRPTPETLWNLAPWSWAVDWVSNFGDVLHNLSALSSDGLVMPYAYVMEESIHEISFVHPDVRFKTYPGKHEISAKLKTTVKQRVPASPYGFGLDPSGFTARQWAILAALGLTRGGDRLD